MNRAVRLLSKAWRLSLTALCVVAAGPLLAADELTWRELDPENTVFMELGNKLVVIELNPVFAPATVKQFKRLAQEHFYEGLSFYRVIDGFVAQGGDGSDLGELSNVPLIDAEFEIEWDKELPFMPVQPTAREWWPWPGTMTRMQVGQIVTSSSDRRPAISSET